MINSVQSNNYGNYMSLGIPKISPEDQEEINSILSHYTNYPPRVFGTILNDPQQSGEVLRNILCGGHGKRQSASRDEDFQFLISKGANCNYYWDKDGYGHGNWSLLCQAINCLSASTLKMMIGCGAQVNIPNPHFMSDPLSIAISTCDIEKVRILINSNVNMNLHEGDETYYKLCFSCSPVYNVLTKIPANEKVLWLKLLLHHGMRVSNHCMSTGIWNLIEKQAFADLELIEVLLSHGLSPNGTCKDGVTVRKKAEKLGDEELLALLKKYEG